jgi:hypothetical protein
MRLACQKNLYYFLTEEERDMNSIADRILRQVRARGPGGVFTPSDFVGLGSRAAVDQALSRLCKDKRLRRLAHGLYDYPRVHARLGALAPAPDVVAKAFARETGSNLQMAGAQAANALGLSTQVPARSVYLTDGPSRRVVLGKRIVDIRHASPKHLVAPGSMAGTVVQALRHLGPDSASAVVDAAAPRLKDSDRRALANGIKQAPAWMRPALDRILQRA